MSRSERTIAYEARLRTVKQVLRRTPGRITPDRIVELLQEVHLRDQRLREDIQNGASAALNSPDLSSKSS